MTINYFEESEKYRPKRVTTLLIGEAPPHKGRSYFYKPKKMNNKIPIEKDNSLPATIFYNYFNKRPETEGQYIFFLQELKNKGIFLIDICDIPLKIREKDGINKNNLSYLKNEIPKLRQKIKSRGITIDDRNIIFLLARSNYKRDLKKEFPNSKYCRWKDFRLSKIELNCLDK